MTSNEWTNDAIDTLTGVDDREGVSIERVRTIVANSPSTWRNTPSLYGPTTTWRINREALPPKLLRKLDARTRRGIGNPVHALGASSIALEVSEREWDLHSGWEKVAALEGRGTLREPSEKGSGSLYAGLSKTQSAALAERLPFDGPMKEDDPLWSRMLDRVRVSAEGNAPVFSGIFGLTAVVFLIGGGDATLLWALGVLLVVLAAEVRGARSLRLTARDYLRLEKATEEAPAPKTGSHEERLASIAHALSQEIQACPAWGSDFLETHRIQLDPTAEADQITEHAIRISQLADSLGPTPDGASEAAARARQHRAGDEQILDTVRRTLTDRVAALYRYAAELHALDNEYQALKAVERSLSVHPDFEELIRQTGSDELATDHLNRLTADAEVLRSGTQAHLGVLTGDLRHITAVNEAV